MEVPETVGFGRLRLKRYPPISYLAYLATEPKMTIAAQPSVTSAPSAVNSP